MPGGEELLPAGPGNLQLAAAKAVDFQPQRQHLREKFGRRVQLEAGLPGRSGFAPDVAGRQAFESQRDGHRRADILFVKELDYIR